MYLSFVNGVACQLGREKYNDSVFVYNPSKYSEILLLFIVAFIISRYKWGQFEYDGDPDVLSRGNDVGL